MLLEQLEEKERQIERCAWDKVQKARDGIKEVSD
jgi:hypothetical protein